MTLLPIGAKGQIAFSKDVLKHLGVAPGDRINVYKLPDGKIEMRAAPAKKK